jgi:streptogramin lyase
MRSLVPKVLAPLAVAVAVLALAAGAGAAPKVTGHFALAEGEIETNNKIVEGPEGNMWVTEHGAEKQLARVTPAGVTREFELGPEVEFPAGIAVGPDKNLWLTEEGAVVRVNPANPAEVKVFAIAAVKAGASIVTGPDGNLWVATTGAVLRFSTANPEGAKAFNITGLAPKDIDVAGSVLAIADFEPRIVTVNTNGTVSKETTIPGGSQGVAGGLNGQIGFSQQGTEPEQVGLLAPPAAPVLVNTPASDPFGVAFGSDDAYWTVLSAKDGVERVTAAGTASSVLGFPVGSMPRQIAAGPGNTMWVTLTNPGKVGEIGLISGLEPPTTPPPPTPTPLPITKRPQTRLGKGPKGAVKTTKAKALVKFSFSADAAGANFECALTKGKKTKKAKLRFATARFHGCRSPRSYRVGAGAYRFKVRAVDAGGVDSTPAERRFRVLRTRK